MTNNVQYAVGGYWDAGHEDEDESSEFYRPFTNYYIASCSVSVNHSYAYLNVANVNNGYIGYEGVAMTGADYPHDYGWSYVVSVRPIVVLPSDIEVQEGTGGVYELAE